MLNFFEIPVFCCYQLSHSCGVGNCRKGRKVFKAQKVYEVFFNCCYVLKLPTFDFYMLNHNVFLNLLYYLGGYRVPFVPGIPFFFLVK